MGHFSKEDLKKLEDRTPSGSGRVNEWFRPTHNKDTGKDRKYKIRLLPLSAEDPYPFFFERMHYFYGKDYLSGVCPQACDGGFCPACDIFFTVWNAPELASKEKEAKALSTSLGKLGPDQRAFANIYDYSSESVKAWSIPYGARKQLDAFKDSLAEFSIIVTDPVEGRDCVINMTALGGGSSKVSPVTAAPNNSELPITDWEAQLKDLRTFAHQRELSAEDLEEVIEAQLGDHYETIMELYTKYKENKTTKDIGEKLENDLSD